MRKSAKFMVVGALAVAVIGVVLAKQARSGAAQEAVEPAVTATQPTTQVAQPLPRLVDLGADKCIPCKAMMPILDQLREDFAGRLEVTFIDVWKNPDEAEKYGVRVIPTQIFFDAKGKELFRHEGFFSREEILGKWYALGFDLGLPAGEGVPGCTTCSQP